MSETTEAPASGGDFAPSAVPSSTPGPEAQPETVGPQAEATPAEPSTPDDTAPQRPEKRDDEESRRNRAAARARIAEREAAKLAGIMQAHGIDPATGQRRQQDTAPAQMPALPQDLAQRVGAPPRPEDFPAGEWDPGFVEAKVRYGLHQEAAQAEMRRRQQMHQQAQAATAEKWQAAAAQAVQRYPDFDEVAYSAPINTVMAETIAESEIGADLAYYLGKNPKEAAAINAMPARTAIRELGRLEERVRANLAAASRPTAAPPPPTTVRGAGSGTAPRDTNKMSPAEYREHYVKYVMPNVKG